MFITFYNHLCETFNDFNSVKTHVGNIIKNFSLDQPPKYISIRVEYEDTVFWDIDGNNIPIESITNFHPEMKTKIEAFIDAFNELPDTRLRSVDLSLNIAQVMALRCRYEMYGYAIVDMMRMLYPNHVIVLEPL